MFSEQHAGSGTPGFVPRSILFQSPRNISWHQDAPGILLEVQYSCVLNSLLPADSLAQMLSLSSIYTCLNQLPAQSEPQNSPGEGTLPRSSAGAASLGRSPGTHGPYSPGRRNVHPTTRLHSVSAADSHCFPATCCPALCLWGLFPPLSLRANRS